MPLVIFANHRTGHYTAEDPKGRTVAHGCREAVVAAAKLIDPKEWRNASLDEQASRDVRAVEDFPVFDC